jgi:hypothetical protein
METKSGLFQQGIFGMGKEDIVKTGCRVPLSLFCILTFVLLGSGCSVTAPKLSPEDRKKDIQFMADWARDNSPFVELAQKHKGTPSYEALLPMYLEYAEQAESNEEFYQVVSEYYKLICPAGHSSLVGENVLRMARIAIFLGIVDVDINPFSIEKSIYWPRLVYGSLSTRAHPPFGITYKDDKYFTDDDWEVEGVTLPRGSQIIKVNGMSCPAYMYFIKEKTPLKYDAFPKDWTKNYLLIIDEGEDFKGWQVDFLLPNKSTHSAFVPKIKGFPDPKEERIQTVEAKDNCTCLELTDDVGYIRIKMFMGDSIIDYLFKRFIKEDRKKIGAFLERSNDKYNKLIIDVRSNGGGLPCYFYENLIRPFLDESVTYDQVAGIRRKYRDNLKKSVLKTLRRDCSLKKQHVVSIEEIDAPEGFDANDWIFYRVTRRIEPRNRYNFDGSVYVLIDRPAFSAADDYANAVKRIGFAKLVGRNTSGGCAAYLAPPAIRLPASGMIFRVETEMVINPDGSINELFGTPPDGVLPDADPPKSITQENLLEDEWIKWILADTQDRAAGDSAKDVSPEDLSL